MSEWFVLFVVGSFLFGGGVTLGMVYATVLFVDRTDDWSYDLMNLFLAIAVIGAVVLLLAFAKRLAG